MFDPPLPVGEPAPEPTAPDPARTPFPQVGSACALTGHASAAASTNVHGLSDDDLLVRLAQVESARRSLEAASAHLVAELDARSVTDERYGTRVRQYLAAQFRTDPKVAGKLLRAGRLLRRLPLVDRALRDGRVTLDHVAVLAGLSNPRVAPVVEGAQEELVQLAGVLRFDAWARRCRALVDLADADGGHRPSTDDRRLSWGWGLDGVLHLSGTLVGAEAIAVEHLLDAHTGRLLRRSRSEARSSGDLPIPTRAQLRADALVDLIRAASPGLGTSPAVEATVVIPVDHPALIGRRAPGVPVPGGGRARRVSLEVGAGQVFDGDVDLLLCDPIVRALVVDSLGVPLDLGHDVRFVTPDQRLALAARDGGCVFPGCDAPAPWTDAHHVVRAVDGGPTDMENLSSLCRHHHGVVHRNGWHMVHTGDQWFSFTTPRGAVLRSQRHGCLRLDSS